MTVDLNERDFAITPIAEGKPVKINYRRGPHVFVETFTWAEWSQLMSGKIMRNGVIEGRPA